VRHILNSELQARQAKLLVEIPNELPPVYGDRVHLQQVMLNLLLNSLDALDESTDENRRIFIQASQIEDGMIQIVLSDNGTGIEPEKLPHLFEPFFTTKEDGMGIGLAISKAIVDAHGGKITAENSPRGGTVVRFTLKAGRSVETQA